MTAAPAIVVAGAGPVGATTALLLARARLAGRLTLADARPAGAARDARAIALNHGSRVLLEGLGAWPAEATPITRIHVSQRGRLGRTLIEHRDYRVPALGYVVAYDRLMAALERALTAAGLAVRHDSPVRLLADRPKGVTVEVSGERRDADLLVLAEGGFFDAQATRALHRDYAQCALVTTVKAEHAPAGWAYERFTEDGPIALLPLGAQHCLVWCGRPEDGARRKAADPADFAAELHRLFGDRVGRFVLAGPRALFPLGLNAHETLVEGHRVRIGNAAQTLHPVAGQGLNLGLRDAAALVQALAASPDDIAGALIRFADARTLDRGLTTRLTDWMARVFATPFAPVQHALGLGLVALDLAPGARALLARQMMQGRR